VDDSISQNLSDWAQTSGEGVYGVRLKYLDPDNVRIRYIAERKRVEELELRGQSSWYSQANALVRLAKLAYALGLPLAESRSWLQQATAAYRELFALRGTTFYKQTRYQDGKPLPEETLADDGYTSVDSFNAALAALTLQNINLARELAELAGHSPSAALVSPRSEVCTTNEQTLSHALNALLASEMDLASREAGKLSARKATNIEKQIALTISAIATNGDVLTERDALLFYHAKAATRHENQLDASFWLCLPALGLSFLAMHFAGYQPADLETESLYCPVALLTESETTGG
jgi:hypothetical protein